MVVDEDDAAAHAAPRQRQLDLGAFARRGDDPRCAPRACQPAFDRVGEPAAVVADGGPVEAGAPVADEDGHGRRPRLGVDRDIVVPANFAAFVIASRAASTSCPVGSSGTSPPTPGRPDAVSSSRRRLRRRARPRASATSRRHCRRASGAAPAPGAGRARHALRLGVPLHEREGLQHRVVDPRRHVGALGQADPLGALRLSRHSQGRRREGVRRRWRPARRTCSRRRRGPGRRSRPRSAGPCRHGKRSARSERAAPGEHDGEAGNEEGGAEDGAFGSPTRTGGHRRDRDQRRPRKRLRPRPYSQSARYSRMPAPPASARNANASRTRVASTTSAEATPPQTPATTRSSSLRPNGREGPHHRALTTSIRPAPTLGVDRQPRGPVRTLASRPLSWVRGRRRRRLRVPVTRTSTSRGTLIRSSPMPSPAVTRWSPVTPIRDRSRGRSPMPSV